MREVLYYENPVTLNASGSGTLTIGPSKRFETWKIDRMVTIGSSASNPDLNVYRGQVAVGAPSDFTSFGNSDISETTTDFSLQEGERLTVVYSGGTSGAVMRFRVEGWKETRYPARF